MKRGDEGLIYAVNGRHIGDRGALDHDDVNAQVTGSGDLAMAGRPAAIFCDDGVDPVIAQQRKVVGLRKGTAIANISRRWSHKRRVDRFNRTHQIIMPWSSVSGMRLLPPERQEYPARMQPQRGNGLRRIGNLGPSVAILTFPGRTAQRDQRHIRLPRRAGGIVRHDGGKGMGSVDQQVDPLLRQIVRKAVNPAKAAAHDRHRHDNRRTRPAREREGDGQVIAPAKPACEQACLGRAAQNQDGLHG